ncbi:MAG: biopolymer transporter ExbD [candidate division WOR-3 bacterium]|nr:biopolymer transporter ExbD [candidate division WOR-3 bacterium]MCX7948154.1 biopolymer transporter ExbD [candidate division WOR-3 bacterium]MDW8151037.1 biopolymer transporter ExbD [candidate division WOR-3 bacterium]
MKIFKERRKVDYNFDFVSLSIASISFIILSFFALSIPKKEKGILFSFPQHSEENTQFIANYIRFSVNDKGEMFVEDQPVRYDEVRQILEKYIIEDTTRSIYLIIHQSATYEYLIKSFDMVNETYKNLNLSPKLYIGVIKR